MRRVLAHCWRETRPRKEVASKQLMMNQMVEYLELYTFWYNFHPFLSKKKKKMSTGNIPNLRQRPRALPPFKRRW
jgi:hypothetical protein